jgi:succinate dehydrogenase flavin-adding protein (antitoxin of CptAB toxin-antitoxin module)
MKELDLLLERFAREHYAGADVACRRAFERLLELPDPLLADYLLGSDGPSDPELARLVGRLRGAGPPGAHGRTMTTAPLDNC